MSWAGRVVADIAVINVVRNRIFLCMNGCFDVGWDSGCKLFYFFDFDG